jgi:hypothetical protein
MSKFDELSEGNDEDIDGLLQHFTESLAIDKLALDECCIQQPTLFEHVSRLLAYRTSLRDEAKRYLAEIEALVDAEIREVEKDQKITEKRIATLVCVEPKVKAAQEKVIAYTYIVNRLYALKEAYEHRRAVLKDLVGLFSAGYWGDVVDRSSRRGVSDTAALVAKSKVKEKREPVSSVLGRHRATFEDQ